MASYKLKYTAEEIDGILESVDEKTIYDDATQSEHGLMSTTDKSKLDSLPTSQQIDNSLSSKQDKIDSSHKLDYSLIANTPTIPTVPTISTDIASDASDNTKTASPKAVKDYVDAHSGGGSTNAVLYTEQTLTSEQKSQARTNIGAGTSSFSGSYNDLTNKPTIPAAQVNADWNASSGVAKILNKPTIPTVPTNVSAFTNDAGYITSFTEQDPIFTASAAHGITSSDITNWNSKGTYSKPSGGIPASDLASGVIPTVPTISTSILSDASDDTKTASPKAVKTYVDDICGDIETILASI